MATGLFNWSRTPASNASATYNMAEGMAPSAVNDGIRGLMSDVAQYRDDIAGAIVTGGSSTAYTVTSYSNFDTLPHLNGQVIGFVPHATNTGAATLNVDGLGAKPLRIAPAVDPTIGMLIAGTPYTAVYNNSDGAFYLHGYLANPQSAIPVGGIIPYAGSTAPNSYFAIPLGQAISRLAFPAAFSVCGTTYGVGDGSTTFNLPDLGGRVIAGKEASASRLTTAGGGIDGGTLGASSSAQNVSLAANQIPSLTSVNSAQPISVNSGAAKVVSNTTGAIIDFPSTAGSGLRAPDSTASAATVTSTGNNNISVAYTNASQVATKVVQPTIVLNNIMRVL